MHGVVVVAGVGGINGEERQVPQVGAACRRGRTQGLDLAQDRRRELVGQPVRVHGDQADLALVPGVAQGLDDPRLGYAVAPAGAGEIEAHEIAVPGLALVAGGDRPFLELLAVHGIDDAAALFS